MRRVLTAAAALALLAPSPAHADAWTNREIAYQVLNVVDTAETVDCMRRGVCQEGNPIIGSHPTPGRMVAFKAGVGVVHFAIARFLRDRDPQSAKTFQIISLAMQGGVVVANARFVF